ncbi:MAG: hypothetical protein M1818_006323 [Claussenomyces sp. TS43310]|nr:MAG: hypothetical protein M1818_006323 [Claussenomyces sp. TS43310]
MDAYEGAEVQGDDIGAGPSTSSGENARATSVPRSNQAFRDNRQAALPPANNNTSSHGGSQRPGPSQVSVLSDRHRAPSNASASSRSPHPRPSEASRLRVLNVGPSPQLANGRHTPDQALSVSRPQPRSSRRSDESLRPSTYSSASYPLPARDEQKLPYSLSAVSRERGSSASSSRSFSAFTSTALRLSTSIPDLGTADTIYNRHRNYSNISAFRAERNYTDGGLSHAQRDVYPISHGVEDEEVRASLRSALTTTSSFLGTSGTERSSVVTKSSSATSIIGRDEGLSVDDAIGMYETGFADSGGEEYYPSRPGTSQSYRSVSSRLPPIEDAYPELHAMSNKIGGDSAAILEEPISGSHDAVQTSQREHASQSSHKRREESGRGSGWSRAGSTTLTADDTRDRYGFRKKSQYISQAQYDAWSGPYEEYLARRRRKWVALMKESGLATENPIAFPAKSTKVKRFIRKGLPPEWRGAAWFWYAGGPSILAKNAGVYDDLIRKAEHGRVDPNDQEIIERDLNRTFPDNIRFKPDQTNASIATEAGSDSQRTLVNTPEMPILQSLRRVLQAFSILNPKIGYCQSLNFLAGLLLLFMEEEKAFWMLNIITRVYLPGTHEVNLEGANVDLGVLMTSIKESMPAIWAKIGGELDGSAGDGKVSMRLPPITLCCTAWFMSCFIGTLPMETTLRVWDSFFYEGSKTLFRIALAIFKVGEAEIRAVNDPMEIFQVVQTIPRRLVDASALMEACFKRRNGFGHLSQATIEARRRERREGYADERAIAAGLLPLARKQTLFGRRRAKSRAVEHVMT